MSHKLISGVRRLSALSALAVVLFIGLVFGPMAQSAAAVTCQEQRLMGEPGEYSYGPDGTLYQTAVTTSTHSAYFTVPGSSVSGCSYVNVKNITGGTGSNGTCWWFRVFVEQSSSTPLGWYPQVYACAGPSTVTGIMGPIANGSVYRVNILPNDSLRFTLRD